MKKPKVYFYDTGRLAPDNPGAKIENLTALCLLKRQHYLEDTLGETCGLYYLRDREKREVDFVTVCGGKIEFLIEVKHTDDSLSSSLRYFSKRAACRKSLQLVYQLTSEKCIDGIEINSLTRWLGDLEI